MGKSEILRSKYAWKEAGIPQPKQGSNIGGLYNLRDLPVPKVMESEKLMNILEELMPWCILRRDYYGALLICTMFWRCQDVILLRCPELHMTRDDPGMYLVYKLRLMLMVRCATEILLASGLAGDRASSVHHILSTLRFKHRHVWTRELMARELALQLLEAGDVDGAREHLKKTMHKKTYLSVLDVPRYSLLGVVHYLDWLHRYLDGMKKPSRRNRHKSLQARAVDEAVGAEAGGAEIAGPLWEYVPRAWAAVSRDIEFRDTWESCERVLQMLIRNSPENTTKVSYYLAHTYCAAGKIPDMMKTGLVAVRAGRGDTDAVALVMMTSRLVRALKHHLSCLEKITSLPQGSASTLLGITLEKNSNRRSLKRKQEDGDDVNQLVPEMEAVPEEEEEEERPTVEWRPEPPHRAGGEAGRGTAAVEGVATGTRADRRRGTAILAAAVRRAGAGSSSFQAQLQEDDNGRDKATMTAADADPLPWGPHQTNVAAAAAEVGAAEKGAAEDAARRRQRKQYQPRNSVVEAYGNISGFLEAHDEVKLQLEALASDPLCAPALAGLVRRGSHCSSCALALTRGCLLHLDFCTSGLISSPYEEEVWFHLDKALTRLAEEAVAAGGHDGDNVGHLASLELWRDEVEPDLKERAQWWVGTAFSEPPVLCNGGATAAGSAVHMPDKAFLAHLQCRARVAVLMLGPNNFHTQHVTYELELLGQSLEDQRTAVQLKLKKQDHPNGRGKEVTGSDDADDCGGGSGGTEMDIDGAVEQAAAADKAVLEEGMASVGACLDAFTEAVECAREIARLLTLSARTTAVNAPAAPPRPLPANLMAGLPRSLRQQASR